MNEQKDETMHESCVSLNQAGPAADSVAAAAPGGESIAPIRLYRPSNGTEGEVFISRWCDNCDRDRNRDCPILASTFMYDTDEKGYPPEWRYGANGRPQCTAWLERGKTQRIKPIQPEPDTRTLALFETPSPTGRESVTERFE